MVHTAVRPALRGVASDRGVSVVEILVAMTVLASVVASVLILIVQLRVSGRDAQQRVQATAQVSQALERARSLTSAELHLATTSGAPASWDPDGAGPMTPELTSTASTGRIGSATDTIYWSTAGDRTLRTYVTLPGTAAPPVARRVTAVVTWQTQGRVREVRHSVLLARP